MLAESLRAVQRDLERERQDHSSTREELGMYKVQLNAQAEIARKAEREIHDLIGRLEKAEQDAADARSMAHQLREELQVSRAREQGRNEGFRAAIRVRQRMDREDEQQQRGRRRALSVDDAVDEVLIERRTPVLVRPATPARRSSSRATSIREPMPRAPSAPRASSRPPPPTVQPTPAPFQMPFYEDDDSAPSSSSPPTSTLSSSESIE